MMKDEIESYVDQLERDDTKRLYRTIYDMQLAAPDSDLSDDFQIICRLLDVFEQFAVRRKHGLIEMPEVTKVIPSSD